MKGGRVNEGDGRERGGDLWIEERSREEIED